MSPRQSQLSENSESPSESEVGDGERDEGSSDQGSANADSTAGGLECTGAPAHDVKRDGTACFKRYHLRDRMVIWHVEHVTGMGEGGSLRTRGVVGGGLQPARTWRRY